MQDENSIPKKKKGKGRLARIEKRMGNINALLLKIGLWVLIIISLGLLWREYNRKYYLIKPIEVPAHISEIGYSSTVVAQRIFDELSILKKENRSVRDFQGFSADNRSAAVDFQVAGFGLSVQSLATQLRMATGKVERIIQGEIVNEGEQLSLRLRVPGQRIQDIKAPLNDLSVALDSLTKTAAFELFKITEPYLYAVYLNNQDDNKKALIAAKALLNIPEEKKWGFNLIANIEGESKNFDKSISYYKMAIADDSEFRLPYKNLAFLYKDLDSIELAVEYFEKAINLQDENDNGWDEANYYMLLVKHNLDKPKQESTKNKILKLDDPEMFNFCAASANNNGMYKETLFWSKKVLSKNKIDMQANIQAALAACVIGNRSACAQHLEQFKNFHPNNSFQLIPETILSILDEDDPRFFYLLDSIEAHHPEIMANSNGMTLFFTLENIKKGDIQAAQAIFLKEAQSENFNPMGYKEIFFIEELFPAMPDSMQQQFRKFL